MIAIFAAMNVEVRACLSALPGANERSIGGFPVIVSETALICQTGLGRQANDAANALLTELSPRVLLSVGTAGGLSPDIGVGDIVFCATVGHPLELDLVTGDDGLISSALETAVGVGLRVLRGASVTVDDVAWTPEGKAKLRDRGAPDIVEMESYWIGKAAAERGLPFLAIRAVSDGPDHHLVDIPNLFDEHGNVISASVIAYTREHPEVIPLLAEQHANGGRALESLTRFLEAFLPRLDRLLRPQSLR